MLTSTWTLASLLLLPAFVSALPFQIPPQRKSITLPFERRRAATSDVQRRDGLAGVVGVGDVADLFYTVALQVGGTTTAANLDTGSSDLWIMSDACKTKSCQKSTSAPYTSSSGQQTGASVNLQYGDSTTGTHASGPVLLDTVAVAGLSMDKQPLAAVNDTNNSAVQNGGAGIFGLGFPGQSFVQAAVVNQEFNTPATTDDFVNNIPTYGPLVSRLATSGKIEQPLFAITLQRDTIDVSGHGQITIGELPQGVDNSSITWVPVRLYSSADGGLNPPSFASNEVYPLRWEIPLDGVYLDGKKLPDTTLTGTSTELSALIDTGNSIIRGPQDVVNGLLSSVSSTFAANAKAQPTFPCATAHTLAFQIGGQMFPIDPRDFVSQAHAGDATTCVANNVVGTDAPSAGALFSWSLGDPFLKSNLVVFYYGNLTHPSVDPPRIGFLSTVPQNATALLQDAVQDAQQDGGKFESTSNVAPTATTLLTVDGAASTPTAPAASQTPAAPATEVAAVSTSTPSPSAPAPSASQKASSGALRLTSSMLWYAVLALLPLSCVL
ncbi:acid protease [Phanerochaete sordida]|uniref:Acid protease n=1 Tax=Phanerochaete sordida TaxID=48140 RepID=A0A9P3GRR8_9APHY|nr:acid protease [Phanerochaete sordida]